VSINFVLSNLAIFMLSFFEATREVLNKLDFYRSKFFWQSNEHKKKNTNLLNGACNTSVTKHLTNLIRFLIMH
jgi:hypothetical protein